MNPKDAIVGMADRFEFHVRMVVGALAFGLWQQNILAGVFAYCFLITLEGKKYSTRSIDVSFDSKMGPTRIVEEIK